MTTKFINKNEPQTTLNYIRSDKLFKGKNIEGTNIRKLLTALAVEVLRSEQKLQDLSDQYDPKTTTLLLDQWEKAIKIPDDCIPIASDSESRRNWILIKLSSLGVSLKEQFEYLGSILGFDITVLSGTDRLSFPYTFPIILTDINPKFVLYVEAPSAIADSVFPYTFPFTFADDKTAILRCLFEKLVPSNVKVIFNFI